MRQRITLRLETELLASLDQLAKENMTDRNNLIKIVLKRAVDLWETRQRKEVA